MNLGAFASKEYQEHNRARLEHLANLDLPLSNRTVLEVGSGPGDHTGFYLERGCTVSAVDARAECLEALKSKYPWVRTAVVDMNVPDALDGFGDGFGYDVVHCYGLLYHLSQPAEAIRTMAAHTKDLLLLETCVDPSRTDHVTFGEEHSEDPTQGTGTQGCRPTRRWLFAELKCHFPFVYQTRTQPTHPEFPTEWSSIVREDGIHRVFRVVMIASRKQILSHLLSEDIIS